MLASDIVVIVMVVLLFAALLSLQRRYWAGQEQRLCVELVERLGGCLRSHGFLHRLWWNPDAIVSCGRSEGRLSFHSVPGGEAGPGGITVVLRFAMVPPTDVRLRFRLRGSEVLRTRRHDLWYRPLLPFERLQLRRTGEPDFDDRIVAYGTSDAAFAELMTPELRRCLIQLEGYLHVLDDRPRGESWYLVLRVAGGSTSFALAIQPRWLPSVEFILGFLDAASQTHRALEDACRARGERGR